MRKHAPVHRHPPTNLPAFWSLTRYEDIRAVYRDPTLFSSAHGVLLRPTACGTDPGGGQTIALTDPPRHKQLRSLIADRFTERSARSLENAIRRATKAVLTRAISQGECDFSHDIAARLSFYVIATLMGVPERDHEALFGWTYEAFETAKTLAGQHQFMLYFAELMDQRTADPADDLVSALVNGTVNDDLLTEREILFNCENLVGASENAGLSMAGGMLAFLEHPDQWQRLRDNRGLLPTAVEEVLRWTSSATHSMRVATAPTIIRGQEIRSGDRVVLWLPSANRDENVFPNPDRFDIARRPNRHLALGIGEHFCVGATMARTQLKILLTELLDTVDRIEPSGPMTPLRSIAVNGPQILPVRLIP
jgi:cytochrome P450